MTDVPDALVEKATQAAIRHVVEQSGGRDGRGELVDDVPEVAEFYGGLARAVLAAVWPDLRNVQDAADVRRAVAEEIVADLHECGYYPAATRIRYRLAHGTNGGLGPAAPTAREAGERG